MTEWLRWLISNHKPNTNDIGEDIRLYKEDNQISYITVEYLNGISFLTFECLSQAMTWISNVISCHGLFLCSMS